MLGITGLNLTSPNYGPKYPPEEWWPELIEQLVERRMLREEETVGDVEDDSDKDDAPERRAAEVVGRTTMATMATMNRMVT